MSLHTPKEISAVAVQAGVIKSSTPVSSLLILGFLAGAFISFGFLLFIRVVTQLPPEWGSFGTLLGASVFPVGIILTVTGRWRAAYRQHDAYADSMVRPPDQCL